MVTINYDDLYKLEDPLDNSPVRLSLIDERFGIGNFYKWISSVYRGETDVDPPLRLTHDQGRWWRDYLWCTYMDIFAISRNILNLIQERGFSGWATYPVEITDKKGNIITGYYGFAITGRAGQQDLWRGQLVTKPPIVPGGPSYDVLKGYYFVNDHWDGNDFCLSGYGGYPIVTKRVFQAFTENKVKNVKFITLLDREIDIGTLRIAKLWPLEGMEDNT